MVGVVWCPPGMLGIGIGGTAEKAMLLAKQSLMDPIDMTELPARGQSSPTEEMRIELYEKVNALGRGAQGLRAKERRVGKECVSTFRSRWCTYYSQKHNHLQTK